MQVNYYLKSAAKAVTSVYAIVRLHGHRYKLSTGIRVEVEFWDKSSRRARRVKAYPESDFVNRQLDAFEEVVLNYMHECILNHHTPTADEFRNAALQSTTEPLQSFCDFFEAYYQKQDYSLQTLKNYHTTAKWLRMYETTFRERLTFENMNIDFYDRFRRWILSQTYHPAKDSPARFYSLNYAGSHIKNISHVLKATGPESINPLHQNHHYKHFKASNETADSVYLSVSELIKIHRWEPTTENVRPSTDDNRESNLTRRAESFKKVKNKFLIGCFTALRVSDFNRLHEVNLQANFIRIKPKKGSRKNEDVIIPIHPVVREIIESGFRVDAPISEQKLNKHIKTICHLVGITDEVSQSRTEGNQVKERTFKKSQLVSTHTARRSGATNMYLAGIPAISIMKITGHRTERNFLKYIRISAEENARQLANHPFFNP